MFSNRPKKTMAISHFGSILKKYVKQNAFLVWMWAKKQELKTFGGERKAQKEFAKIRSSFQMWCACSNSNSSEEFVIELFFSAMI